MQFVRDGEFYKVARITGPTHNFLGLSLERARPDHLPDVEALDMAAGSGRLDAARVVEAAQRGVAAANEALGSEFLLVKVMFVSDDSPPEDVYESLAEAIIRELVHGTAFSD